MKTIKKIIDFLRGRQPGRRFLVCIRGEWFVCAWITERGGDWGVTTCTDIGTAKPYSSRMEATKAAFEIAQKFGLFGHVEVVKIEPGVPVQRMPA